MKDEDKAVIKLLDLTKYVLTEYWWDSWSYDQSRCEPMTRSECGCCCHFLYIYMSLENSDKRTLFTKWINHVFLNHMRHNEWYYVYGKIPKVIQAAKRLGLSKPDSFEREDAVERINQIITRIKNESLKPRSAVVENDGERVGVGV